MQHSRGLSIYYALYMDSIRVLMKHYQLGCNFKPNGITTDILSSMPSPRVTSLPGTRCAAPCTTPCGGRASGSTSRCSTSTAPPPSPLSGRSRSATCQVGEGREDSLVRKKNQVGFEFIVEGLTMVF